MQEFAKFLCVHKGLQPVTIHGHLKAVERICRRVGTFDITQPQAENFIFSLYQSGYSYTHKTNQVKALEYWFEYHGQSVRFGRQRKPRPIIKQTLTEAEVTRMLFCCHTVRERAIISLLAYSGIRPKELCNVKVQDFDFGSNQLKVIQGKGAIDSTVYISASCTRVLFDYLSQYSRPAEANLFSTTDGLRPLNPECMRKLCKTLAKRAGLTKRVYPYLLRHSLATNMINRGANILLVKKQLRHAWIDTTMLYIHSLGYGIKNEYEQFAPSYE